MRRLAIAVSLLAAALGMLALSRTEWADDTRRDIQAALLGVEPADYRVDAIFDTGRGVIPGQLVKVAGARVGAIEAVELTPDYKVRVEMRVEQRFAPFRADARCAIQPEGVIGERFVQCDPGTPDGAELSGRDGRPPTVPVERTSLPVELNDVFEIFSADARQRIPLIVATLGLGFAGRGEDVNGLLRRANPALASVRRVLGVVERHRRLLQTTISASDRVLAELAGRRRTVRSFLGRAAAVTTETASRRSAVAEATRRLPPLLAQAEPALARLGDLAKDATPVLADLRASAPALTRLVQRARPFAAVATPTVRDLSALAPDARAAVRAGRPVTRRLRGFARDARPAGTTLATVLTDLRDAGFVDNLLRTTSQLSTAVSRYDSVSHLFGLGFFVSPLSGCLLYAVVPNDACRSKYAGAPPPQPAAAPRERAAAALDPASVRESLDYLLK